VKAYKNAIALSEAKLKVNPNDAYTLAFLASYHAMLDHKQAALKTLNQAVTQNSSIPEVSFRIAIVYNHFADTENAVASLEKALKAGFSKSMALAQPDFEPLHDNPKFKALLQ